MRYNYLIFLIILLGSCKTTDVNKVVSIQNGTEFDIPRREYSVQSVLWQQLSGEYKALCYQAFNSAKIQLDKILLEENTDQKPPAIITDIDETLIDNSPYNAKMIETDKDYSKNDWIAWGLLEKAVSVPGSVEFLKYAASKGVQVYYISNRYDIQQQETMTNLKKLGFPFIDDDHMLLRQNTSGKEDRRQKVLKNCTVVMLLGDNLSDFTDLFDNKSTAARNQLVDNLQHKFGKEFIVLPNPMYGDWETKGLYEGNYNWTPAQKDSIRRAKLISY